MEYKEEAMKLTHKLIRKMGAGIFAAILLSSNIYANTPELLHSSQKIQTITKGATYITDSRLTTQGWQDLHVLKVNLEDSNIQVRPIESSNIGEKQTILSLVQAAGAVAGVNADFFDMSQQIAPSFGLVIDNGKLTHGYNDKAVGLGASKNMGTMLIDNNKNVMLDYFSVNFTIQDGWTGNVLTTLSSVNKPTGNLTTPVYLDRSYGPTTIPLETPTKKLYKIIVEDGVVTKIVEPGQAVNIPQNGYVLVMGEEGAQSRLGLFTEGQQITFTSHLSLSNQFVSSIEDIEAGVGGGGLIMKNGEAYTGPAHKVSPASRQPRTVIGTTQDGKTLFLITIDGRGDSIGATHNELVHILKSYGVYTAMHLDGGGSTTFVSREEGTSEVKVQNNPSGGSQRRVTNGIGVFTTSSPGNISKLNLSSTYDRTFINTPIAFSLKAVDENDNPVSLSGKDIKWSVEGITGDWKNSSFYPKTEGKGLVIAKVNGVEVAKPIIVSKAPVGLQISTHTSTLKVGESTTVQVLGIDSSGYSAPVAMDQLQWSVSSGAIGINGNKITAIKEGQAIVTGTLKSNENIKAKTAAVVGNRTASVESFENDNLAIWGGGIPATVTGRVEPCKDLKYHGNTSLKFIYNLEKIPKKQVAYMKFTSPITIGAEVESIGMWVYGNGQGDMLKVELVDPKGKATALQVGEINFKGWKYLSAVIPQNVSSSTKLTRMYTITTNNQVARTSSLYIDHISVNYGTRDRDASYLRAHEKFDPLHKTLNNQPPKGSYDFTLMGTTKMNHYPLEERIKARITNNLQLNSKFAVFSGQTDESIPALKIPSTTWKNTLSTYTYENTQIVHLGTNSGGIVKTNPAQWNAFKQILDQSTSDHIMVILNKDPFSKSGFTDSREGNLFHEILAEQVQKSGKNIVVAIGNGYDTDVYIKDGIRYMYINGLMNRDDNISSSKMIRFRITGKGMEYAIESVLADR